MICKLCGEDCADRREHVIDVHHDLIEGTMAEHIRDAEDAIILACFDADDAEEEREDYHQ